MQNVFVKYYKWLGSLPNEYEGQLDGKTKTLDKNKYPLYWFRRQCRTRFDEQTKKIN